MEKEIDYKNIKNIILEILYDRAPNHVRILKIYELLEKENINQEEAEKAINILLEEKKIIKEDRNKHAPAVISEELKRRTSIGLPKYEPGIPIKGDYKIGNTRVIRMLAYDKLSGEDINEITEALKEYIDNLDQTFEERIQKETSKIYRQMIGIFGVFVSIFAVIVISTDKMLRFSPDVLRGNWWDLFYKSSALFLPVGLVVGGLVYIVLRSSKK